MYQIIAKPEDYQIDHLLLGTGNVLFEISRSERNKWANEILIFSEKLIAFAKRVKELAIVLTGSEKISATPASLKTLKIQLFTINDAMNFAFKIADCLEKDIVKINDKTDDEKRIMLDITKLIDEIKSDLDSIKESCLKMEKKLG